jgi:hypothetical protein
MDLNAGCIRSLRLRRGHFSWPHGCECGLHQVAAPAARAFLMAPWM